MSTRTFPAVPTRSLPPSFMAGAALFHILVTIGMLSFGKAALAPAEIEAHGVALHLATDCVLYRAQATHLAATWLHHGPRAWLADAAPLHARLYSLSFALFSPLFGDGIGAAEPLNLLYYLLIVSLVFSLGRAAFDRRTGLAAAFTVALWPSFVLHTTQLLRDPLFMVAMLLLLRVCIGLLSQSFGVLGGVAAGAIASAAALMISQTRGAFWEVVLTLLLAASLLLLLRQVRERRVLSGNLLALALLFTAIVAITVRDCTLWPRATVPLQQQVETLLHRVNRLRYKFIHRPSGVGSNIDPEMRFGSLGELIGYAPRALSIGLFAPFPGDWVKNRSSASRQLARSISGAEMAMFYVLELLALIALWHDRRHLPAWLLFSFAIVGMAALGMTVLNVGALYRMRYVFGIAVVVLGARGADLCHCRPRRGG